MWRASPLLVLSKEQPRELSVRTLFNRCGDRELLLALMALMGVVVILVNS
jgi:hypothetical protein